MSITQPVDQQAAHEQVAYPGTRPPPALPICVDLDGTLLRTDTLVEGLLGLLGSPADLPGVLAAAARGRAALKQRVTAAVPLDPTLLPYNTELLAWLRSQKQAGRTLVLVTAADRAVAEPIATHLGLFDEVMASDGTVNLKGARKAEALVARFGRGGFAYAGDSPADRAVWEQAGAAIPVGRGERVAAATGIALEARFAAPGGRVRAAVRAMRPHQWVKNILVFVPIFTAQALGEAAAWSGAVLAFLALCATASAIYIVNDLSDLAADRAHPRKRLRPFASGVLPPAIGLAMAAVLLPIGLALAAVGGLLPAILIYAVLSIGYSTWLKTQPLVDVFALAALYTIRLFAGGEATGHLVSLWLLAFSSFLFLSLALVKRVEELRMLAAAGGRRTARRGYEAADAGILQSFGIGAMFASTLVLALYVQSEAIAARYATPGMLWGLVPLLLFWQCRIWLSTARGYMHDDPIVYAASDRVSWAVVAGIVVLLVLARLPLGSL